MSSLRDTVEAFCKRKWSNVRVLKGDSASEVIIMDQPMWNDEASVGLRRVAPGAELVLETSSQSLSGWRVRVCVPVSRGWEVRWAVILGILYGACVYMVWQLP
jgi:hypothetical protein